MYGSNFNLVELGSRLQTSREQKGLSRKEVSQQLHIAASTVESHEKGRRMISSEYLFLYASIYKVTFEFLLKGIETPNEELYEKIRKLSLSKKKFLSRALDALELLK